MDNNVQRLQPTVSDVGGRSPNMSDGDGPRPTRLLERKEAHALTSTEVTKIFEHAGLLRTQRSIERYCKAEKLDCFFDPDEQRYYITRGSVDRLVGQLKEIQARHENIVMDDTQSAVYGMRQEPTQKGDNEKLKEMEAKLKEMEDKVFNLSINDKAKEIVITQMRNQVKEDREQYTAELIKHTRRVVHLETELRQLQAPKSDNYKSSREAVDAEYTEPVSYAGDENHAASEVAAGDALVS